MSHVIPSPNIWEAPDVYEIENRGVDRDRVIESAMREIADWAGGDVVDIGCGTGYHLPLFAATARSVLGVEPHPPQA
jgi:predicted RNA methylase